MDHVGLHITLRYVQATSQRTQPRTRPPDFPSPDTPDTPSPSLHLLPDMKPTAAARQADTLVYLDDYIDTVEALPLELQRNFTLMRELDGYAQELMEIVANESLGFIDNVRTMTLDERLARLKQLGTLLGETLKRGEEKVALAKSTYDTVDRHCTRLDTDLQKFEDEQMIGPGRISVQLSGGLSSRKDDGVGAGGEKKSKTGLDKKDKESRGEKRAANASETTPSKKRKLGTKDTSSPPPLSRSLGTLKEGKSTKGNGGDKDKTGSAAPGAASGKAAAGVGGGASAASKSKGKEKGSEKEKGVSAREDGYGAGNGGSGGSKEKGGKKATAITSDMAIDPNEPLYCYCQQISFGEMVACDNEDCEIEWFHIACVDLKTVPKGKWFCTNCGSRIKGKQKKQ